MGLRRLGSPFFLLTLLFLGLSAGCSTPALPLNERLNRVWHEAEIETARPRTISDAHFLRRLYLDLTGLPPKPEVILQFLEDKDPEKRIKIVDKLLVSDEFAVYQAHLWGDELRIKAEFPINLWPNAVQKYSRYIYETIRDNVPYDRFARELLTSSGSNFRIPAANFFRAAADRSPKGLAQVTSQTFFGKPLSAWSVREQEQFIPFFTCIGYKSSKEWKEEFVFFKSPAPGSEMITAAVPGRRKVEIPAGTDPRKILADEIIASEPFAEAMVCRAWRRLFGREPVTPELSVLRREMAGRFRAGGFDLRQLYREILLSPAYSLPPGTPEEEKVFAAYPIRRLNAEQISDRLSMFLRKPFESYSSVIPEPFTFLPPGTRASAIEDGSISSPFLDLMGKPPRDSGAPEERKDVITGKQKLFLLNSGKLYRELQQAQKHYLRQKNDNLKKRVIRLYLAALARPVTPQELAFLEKKYKSTPPKLRGRFYTDLLWALVNSNEFIYQY